MVRVAACGARRKRFRLNDYPEIGVYHPRMPGRVSESIADLPRRQRWTGRRLACCVMRSYILAGNTGHYDGVIAALEARGLRVIPAFATGLDARPAIERYFFDGGRRASTHWFR